MAETTATATETPEIAPTALTDEALAKVFADPEDQNDLIDDTPLTPTPGTPAAAPVTTGIDLSLVKDDDASAEATAPAPVAPPENPLAKMVMSYFPNEESVNLVVGGFQRDAAFQKALDSGDLQGVVGTLGPRTETLMEAIYQDVNLRNAFLDRAIADATGQKTDPEVLRLRREMDELRNERSRETNERTTASQREMLSRQDKGIDSAITGFLDGVRFPNDPRHAHQRELFRKATLADLAMTGKLQDARKGNLSVVRATLRPLVQAWVEADKPKTQNAEQARTKLEQKPKPVTTGATATAAAEEAPIDVFQQAANFVAADQRRRNRR